MNWSYKHCEDEKLRTKADRDKHEKASGIIAAKSLDDGVPLKEGEREIEGEKVTFSTLKRLEHHKAGGGKGFLREEEANISSTDLEGIEGP